MSKKIFILLFIISLFFTLSLHIYSDEMIPISITVYNSENTPLEDTSIKIGDLIIKTDRFGKATTSLFPALYDMSISKLNYFDQTSSIDVSNEKNTFSFILETKLTPISIKVVDALTGIGLLSTIKVTKNTTSSSFSSPNISGDLNLFLEKNMNYTFEIEEKNFKKFEFKLDTSKLLSSSFLFKLERLSSDVNFKFNINEGSITLKFSETNSLYKDFSFSNGILSTSIPYGKYDISIKSSLYKTSESSITVDTNSYTNNFTLLPNFKSFYFAATTSDSSIASFLETFNNTEKDSFIKNLSINIYKNKELIRAISQNKEDEKLDLVFDSYDIEVKSPTTDTAFFKFEPNDSTPQYIKFSVKQMLAGISGILKLENSFLGGVTILFSDNNGNDYSATSSLDGSYSLKLPAKTYTVKILKEGYRTKDSKEIAISNLKPNEISTLNIDLEEVPSLIMGKVVTLDGKPVKDSKLTFRIDKEEVIAFSKEDGSYSASIKSGLVSIRVEKSGYKSKGTVKSVNKFSTLTGVDFKLEQMLSSIEGNITNGVIPIKNVLVKLLDSNKTVVSKSLSKESGSFIFENLPVFSEYTISIEDSDYFPYNSQTILLNMEQIKNFNILLKKNSFSVIIEIKDTDQNPLSNTEVSFNNKSVLTDINGIAEYESQVDTTGAAIILIKVPSSNYSDSIEVNSKTVSPIKKEIVLKNNLKSTGN